MNMDQLEENEVLMKIAKTIITKSMEISLYANPEKVMDRRVLELEKQLVIAPEPESRRNEYSQSQSLGSSSDDDDEMVAEKSAAGILSKTSDKA
jgi:hypothetical protein